MSADIPVVRAKATKKVGYWVGTNLVGELVPVQYMKGWDFSVVGNEGKLSLGVIWAWAQVLMHQIKLLNVELQRVFLMVLRVHKN
jgi:hypothetical protein